MTRIKKTLHISYNEPSASFMVQYHMPHLTPAERARVIERLFRRLLVKP